MSSGWPGSKYPNFNPTLTNRAWGARKSKSVEPGLPAESHLAKSVLNCACLRRVKGIRFAGMDAKTLSLISLGVIWYIIFLFSTVCHEGAHALVAKLGGDLTAFHGGQVTLNPIPHIRRELFGTVIVPIASYVLGGWMIGWASAPYDPIWAQRHPRRAAWMALAGPAANFTLMILAGIGIHVGMAMGVFHMPQSASFKQVTEAAAGGPQLAATALSILFVLNLLLGTFNLIPFPPLDGHNGITVLMSEGTARRFMASRFAGIGILGMVVAWVIYDKAFPYIFTLALNLLYPGAHYGFR
jgi:Zn-dependent protease